jgi:hypothetical protein
MGLASRSEAKESASFCEQKEAKKLYYTGALPFGLGVPNARAPM